MSSDLGWVRLAVGIRSVAPLHLNSIHYLGSVVFPEAKWHPKCEDAVFAIFHE